MLASLTPLLPACRLPGVFEDRSISESITRTKYTYDPFGSTSVFGASNGNTFQYTGRENDGNGLYYYRARYYSPVFGRFISEDPLGLTSGLNAYTYALNDPVLGRDPTGKDTQWGIGVSLTLFGITLGGGGGGGIGISTNGTISGTSFFMTEQADVMAGAGLYGGVGLGATVGHSNGPLTSSTGVWSAYGEADVGLIDSAGISAAVPINSDYSLDWSGTNGSIGAPVKALPGLGLGLAAGAGVQYSSTQVSPNLGQMWNSGSSAISNWWNNLSGGWNCLTGRKCR